jgi:hypothetical protein
VAGTAAKAAFADEIGREAKTITADNNARNLRLDIIFFFPRLTIP